MATTDVRAADGRTAALLVWGLYLLSIPSLAIFVPIGLLVAYSSRPGTGGFVRAHFDEQIRLFWVAFWWAVGIALATVVAWVLTLALIGFLLLWILGAVAFLVMIWFTIKSLLGFVKLLEGRLP